MNLLFNEKLFIFLFIFLILTFLSLKISPGQTTPISFFWPKGTSTMSPVCKANRLLLYVNGKLNIFGNSTCAFMIL